MFVMKVMFVMIVCHACHDCHDFHDCHGCHAEHRGHFLLSCTGAMYLAMTSSELPAVGKAKEKSQKRARCKMK